MAQMRYAQVTTTSGTVVGSVADLQMALHHKAIGQRIADLRKRKRFTQEYMANQLGVSYRGYQGWEAGQMPSWPNLEKIAAFHNVAPEYIIGADEDPAPDAFGLTVSERLERVEAKLDLILQALNAPAEDQDAGHPAPSDPPARKRQPQNTTAKPTPPSTRPRRSANLETPRKTA